MVGVIITGHGGFASGIYSSVNLLAGKPEHFVAVDFTQEDTADEIEYKLRAALKELDCREVLILSDIMNGTPYKEALELKRKSGADMKVELVAGVNLPMVLQINLARGYVADVSDLAQLAVEEGKRQIVRFEEG